MRMKCRTLIIKRVVVSGVIFKPRDNIFSQVDILYGAGV